MAGLTLELGTEKTREKRSNVKDGIALRPHRVGTDVSVAVVSALSANIQAVVDAVHSDLSSTDFSWMSMSDIDSLVGDI